MGFAAGIFRALNLPLESLSSLHGIDDAGTRDPLNRPVDAFLDNGGLVRFGILHGTYSTPDPELYAVMIAGLAESLVTLFRAPGHEIEMSFQVDPDRASEFLTRHLEPYRRQARAHGLDLDAVFASRVRDFGTHIAPQVTIIALRTLPAVLMPYERKRADTARENRRKDAGMRDWIQGGQDFTAVMPELRHIHDQAWYTLAKSLDRCGNVLMNGNSRSNGIRLEALTADQAIDWIRGQQRSGTYPLPNEKPEWTGVGLRSQVTEKGRLIGTSPRLGLSAIPEEMIEITGGMVQAGSLVLAPVVFSLGPVNPKPFDALLENLIQARIPARFNFQIVSGGSGALAMKKMAAEMLYLTTKPIDNGNGLIKEAIREIQLHAAHDPVVLMKAVAVTWAKSPEQAAMQQQTLLRLVEIWGNQETTVRCGDPVQTVLSSLPGLMTTIAAPAWPANLSQVLELMPLDRPASPWTHGPFFLRDKNGKILFVSHELQTPIVAFTGAPGRGKSMAMALQLFSYIWDVGVENLPQIAIIDVGYSSIEFIEAVRQALGEKAYLAQGFTLSLTGETINPFDTPLGFRLPTANHLSFLKNLIGVICGTGNIDDAPILKLSEAVSAAVMACYRGVSDMEQGEAKRYESGMDDLVDAAIQQYGFDMDRIRTWWEVTDLLFAQGDMVMAGRAQRFAVPVIRDLIHTCTHDADLRAKYGDLKVQNQKDLIGFISLSLGEAVNDWPIIARPSTFDFGQARIVSLDLAEVTQGQDPSALRQATAMYLLARFKTSQNFIFSKDDVAGHLRPQYREYHLKRADQIKKDVKIAVWDELHRTGGLPQIPNQIERDGREGRKNGLRILLGSQSFRDIPATIQDILGAAYIMGLDGMEIDTIIDRTGIDAVLAAQAVDHCIGPGEKGAGTLAYWKREDRRYSSLAYVIAGPVELWALTTHPESRTVKNRILKEVPYSTALNLLAARFPSGTIKKELARRKGLAQGGEDFLEEIAREVIRLYQTSLLNPVTGLNP